MRQIRIILLFVFCYCITQQTHATYQVGVLKTAAPFAFYQDGVYTGLTVALWQKIAEKQNWAYTFVPFDTKEQAYHELQKGHVDLILGPFAIHPYENITYSAPYFLDDVTLLTQAHSQRFWTVFLNSFKNQAGSIFLLTLVVGFLMVNLMWFFERKKAPLCVLPYWQGIGKITWSYFACLSALGLVYNPHTNYGMIITGVWIIFSIFVINIFIGSIASSFTLSNLETRINTIDQMKGQRFGVVNNRSRYIDLLRFIQGNAYLFPTIPKAIDALNQNTLEGIVGRFSELNMHQKNNLTLSSVVLETMLLAFPLKKDKPFVTQFNKAFNAVKYDNILYSLCQKYLDQEGIKRCIS